MRTTLFHGLVALIVALLAFSIYGLTQISAGRTFCHNRGNEFAAAYIGGAVACVETTNGTRKVVTYQRK